MRALSIIILAAILSYQCRTAVRETGRTEMSLPVTDAYKIVAPDAGTPLRTQPDSSAKALTVLPKNSRVKVLEYSREKKDLDGKKTYWAKVQAEHDSEIITGWVYDGFLAPIEIPSSSKNQLDQGESVTEGPVPGRIIGRFMLVHCDYNPGYSTHPYFFLGASKQFFSFGEDGTCTFDVNTCSGANKEEGSFSQQGRTITATINGEQVLITIINGNSLRITGGTGPLSCYVCREARLSRVE